MKIKEGFTLMKVGIQNIVVAVGDEAQNFNGMIRLNETGEFLWQYLVRGASMEELVSKMLEEYDIDEATAKADINDFVSSLESNGVIEK